MIELLFKYPAAVFTKGKLVLLSGWPVWLLLAGIAVAALLLGLAVVRGRGDLRRGRLAAIWALQVALVALLMALLWRPAVSISTLKPQQNIVAVLIDDSRSMALREDGATRTEQSVKALKSGALDALARKFQVRLYRFGGGTERIAKLDQLASASASTHIGDSLNEIVSDAASLPIGAVVLLSDGADNSGGIDRETIASIRSRRIPVHTVGVGREQFDRDVEIADVTLPARSLAGARLAAQVSIRQRGYSGRTARLSIEDGGKALTSRQITFNRDGALQTESVFFNASAAGVRNLRIAIEPVEGEQNTANNAVTRLVAVDSAKPRILYIEGEPRWEFKFIRRAIEEDRNLELVSMLRTTQNKIYRQGIAGPNELAEGFPATAEELFGFQGLIIGTVEAGYFTETQRDLIRRFVDRRGGGLLFLGGRSTLAEGGYPGTQLSELLPVVLPEKKGTFHREDALAELTPAGRDSLICRIEEQADRNAERWRKLPPLADYQETGEPKPGAVVLAEAVPAGSRRFPLLVTENYGRGRTALFATGGSWRWRMLQDHADTSHQNYWQQLVRWLVTGAPGRVTASTPKAVIEDEARAPLRVEVRDKSFEPVRDARVEAHVLGPAGASGTIELSPRPQEEGVYSGDWAAETPGSYVVEVVARRGDAELGRDVITLRREDGVAENFRAEQNRDLLEKLASETGGGYYKPASLNRLPDEISYSEAGISVRETRDLWDMPAVFLCILALCAAQWLLRRKWGVV
jgi:uncharacterized membrane protein